jgi:hypothetical protein
MLTSHKMSSLQGSISAVKSIWNLYMEYIIPSYFQTNSKSLSVIQIEIY